MNTDFLWGWTMLKVIRLRVGERRVLAAMLRQLEAGDLTTARNLRDVRRRCELRAVDRWIDKLDERIAEFGFGRLTWGALLEPGQLLDEMQGALAQKPEEDAADRERLERLLDDAAQLDGAAREFTLDEVYVAWVNGLCEQQDWSAVTVREQGRAPHTIKTAPGEDLLVLFADLADRVAAAMAAPPVEKRGG